MNIFAWKGSRKDRFSWLKWAARKCVGHCLAWVPFLGFHILASYRKQVRKCGTGDRSMNYTYSLRMHTVFFGTAGFAVVFAVDFSATLRNCDPLLQDLDTSFQLFLVQVLACVKAM